MDLTITQIILILFITFPVIIHSKNSCPNSSCGSSSLHIKYPFKLETDQPPKYCYCSINLRCDDQGNTVINIPYFGEFYVTDIDYYYRKIAITDPGNCLSRRLMTNFSVYPLSAYSYENYTFYVCPKERVRRGFRIPCLSNSTNATTVVTTADSSEYIGCKPIVSSMIPVSLGQYDDWENFGYLELTWNFPPCKHCELHDDPEKPGDTKSKFVKLIFGSTVFIPLAAIFITFFGIACFIRILKLIVGGATTDNTATGNTAGDSSTATVAPPQATGGAPPGTTSAMPGTETSKVKIFSQVVEVLGESHLDTLKICSICLEEYNGKDRVRSLGQCGHLFHAECIDQWLQKNTTCPICRTSLSAF